MNPTRVLLVEGDDRTAERVRAALVDGDLVYRVERALDLTAALERLDRDEFDVVLLDPTASGAGGTDAVEEARERAPRVPVVALTDAVDEDLAERAVRAGAQDYALKSELGSGGLRRAIRYAVERHRLLRRLGDVEDAARHDREVRVLGALAAGPPTRVTAGLYDGSPLREAAPRAFRELAGRYGEILEQAVEARTLESHDPVSPELRALAEQLGALFAGPRDVVDLHRTALERRSAPPNPRSRRLVEEGRYVVLELMGYLAAHYRNRCRWPPDRTPQGSEVPRGDGNV